MPEPLLDIRSLSVSFRTPTGDQPALRDLDLSVQPGETVTLMGESGSAKSTALFAILSGLAGNARIDSGEIFFEGRDLLRLSSAALQEVRGNRIAMVFQDPTAALNPTRRVGDQLLDVIARHLRLTGSKARAEADALLELMGFPDPARVFDSYPHNLSGGMRQRICIALALSGRPDLLLLDEPTTGLDALVQHQLLTILKALQLERGFAMLFVTHDFTVVEAVSDRICVLYSGEQLETAPLDAVRDLPMHPYTQGLLAAIPRLGTGALPRPIRGLVDRDSNRFTRCVFDARCAFAETRCRQERPTLRDLDGRRIRCHFAERVRKQVPTAPGNGREAARREQQLPLIQARNLSVTYGQGRVFPFLARHGFKAVTDVCFTIRQGETLAIVGESGSGKSTIARTLMGLTPPYQGELLWEGQEVATLAGEARRRFRDRVQMVFQSPSSSLNPYHSVAELVSRPLICGGVSKTDALARTATMLEQVSLDPDHFMTRRQGELSGGEKQRVALARAFVCEPDLVVLDEPTTALDVSVQAQILTLLEKLQADRKCAYLLISHDLAVVEAVSDRIIVMRNGKVVEEGPTSRLVANPIETYTRQLIQAAFTERGVRGDTVLIDGGII